MPTAYVYSAALWCEDCGDNIRATLDAEGKRPDNPDDESSYDSDAYPKGPYPDGGGEADSPQHCDGCRTFLENPLTGDGYTYVREQAAPYIIESDRDADNGWIDHPTIETIAGRAESAGAHVLAEWIRHYGIWGGLFDD